MPEPVVHPVVSPGDAPSQQPSIHYEVWYCGVGDQGSRSNPVCHSTHRNAEQARRSLAGLLNIARDNFLHRTPLFIDRAWIVVTTTVRVPLASQSFHIELPTITRPDESDTPDAPVSSVF